jgi:hypothetical protein
MRYQALFEKIKVLNRGKAKLYIDVENLELFRGLGEVSKKLGKHAVQCSEAISHLQRINGRLIEKFDEWQKWDNWEKERYTKKNNIFFIYGED